MRGCQWSLAFYAIKPSQTYRTNTLTNLKLYISNINTKSEDKNAGVKEVLQIFIQVTGEHSSKEAVKKKCTHERKIQKAQCRNTKAEGSGACIAIRRPRKKRKKNLIDLSYLRVCGSIAFPSRNLECYKNLIIEEKIKVMSCFMAFSLSGSVSRELPTKAASMMLAGNVRYLYWTNKLNVKMLINGSPGAQLPCKHPFPFQMKQ